MRGFALGIARWLPGKRQLAVLFEVVAHILRAIGAGDLRLHVIGLGGQGLMSLRELHAQVELGHHRVVDASNFGILA